MANWWDEAPVVAPAQGGDKWWEAAPVVEPAPAQDASDARNTFLGKLDSAVRGVADAATFGMADEIAAGLGTGFGYLGDYNQELARQRGIDTSDNENRFGYRLGGQIAGALATPAATARTLAQAAGQGAAYGAAYGFGSGEGGFANRRDSAAIGGGEGLVAGGALHGVGNAFATRAAQKSIPTPADLRAASEAGYASADAAGVIVRPDGMQRLAADTVQDLANFGYHPQLQPRIGAVLDEMGRLSGTNTSYKGLETFRKIVGQVAASTDPAERAMATRIMGRLDDYMGNLPAGDVLTGNAAQASSGIQQGRENWARMRRAEMVDTAAIKAERRADTTGTGGNLDNVLRQNVRQIIDNPKRSRGMTDLEKQLADQIIHGTPTQNALRWAGRLSPTTGGLSAMMHVGATAVNPLYAIPGAIGMGAKAVADNMTKRNVERLREAILSGGFTAEQLAEQAGRGVGKQDLVDAITGIRRVEGKANAAAARALPGLMNYVPGLMGYTP
ncbi:hypothetical protein [Xanthobacter sediminis]